LKINACKINNTKHLGNNNVSFTSDSPPVIKYKVKNSTFLKKAAPIIAFAGAITASLAYLTGSIGLFYDIYADKKQKNNNKHAAPTPTKKLLPTSNLIDLKLSFKQDIGKEDEGVKTIIPTTKFAKNCMNVAKFGIMASATSGLACGIGEGMPIMALGEATNLGASNIIETPLGTGLFGIGIASIFASYALDNTPNKKLNHFKVLAKNTISEKAKIYLENLGSTVKEVFSSMGEIAKNFYKPDFIKENILRFRPKNLIFQENIDQHGVIAITRTLRHNKNILLHAASFTLGLGGSALVLTSLLKAKKAQKAALKVEEGGFLVDNIGMAKIGLDKITTNQKLSGRNFAVGGIINAISQFMGIDNKDGRAMQWLGIFFVFTGFSVDRGKFLKNELTKSRAREALTDVVREWSFDLSKIFKDKKELNNVIKELQLESKDKPVLNKQFIRLEKQIRDVVNNSKSLKDEEFKNKEFMKHIVVNSLGTNDAENFSIDVISTPEKVTEILKKCSIKIFGETPVALPPETKKK